MSVVRDVRGQMRVVSVPIGAWNMVSTTGKAVSLDVEDIDVRAVQVVIISDAGGNAENLEIKNNVGTATLAGAWTITSVSDIFLTRLDAGPYNTTGFDSTAVNRGFVTVWYGS